MSDPLDEVPPLDPTTAGEAEPGASGSPEQAAHAAADADRGVAAFVLGIVGDSGSGKDTVADAVVSLLGSERIADLRLDDYRRYNREERVERGLSALNPEIHDLELIEAHLMLLRSGRQVRVRRYLHQDGSFAPVRTVESKEVVLVRGSLGFATDELLAMYDLSVFLQPEPDLLFRWKLRRDTLFRGYTEPEVLKLIASHLLDAKQYVLPQADRADLLVRYHLPDWEAPDSTVVTTLRMRGQVAAVAAATGFFDALPVVQATEGDDVVVTIPDDVTEDAVGDWARRRFPDAYRPEAIGTYVDESGATLRRASLAVVEVLIACLASEMMRGPEA